MIKEIMDNESIHETFETEVINFLVKMGEEYLDAVINTSFKLCTLEKFFINKLYTVKPLSSPP